MACVGREVVGGTLGPFSGFCGLESILVENSGISRVESMGAGHVGDVPRKAMVTVDLDYVGFSDEETVICDWVTVVLTCKPIKVFWG